MPPKLERYDNETPIEGVIKDCDMEVRYYAFRSFISRAIAAIMFPAGTIAILAYSATLIFGDYADAWDKFYGTLVAFFGTMTLRMLLEIPSMLQAIEQASVDHAEATDRLATALKDLVERIDGAQ